MFCCTAWSHSWFCPWCAPSTSIFLHSPNHIACETLGLWKKMRGATHFFRARFNHRAHHEANVNGKARVTKRYQSLTVVVDVKTEVEVFPVDEWITNLGCIMQTLSLERKQCTKVVQQSENQVRPCCVVHKVSLRSWTSLFGWGICLPYLLLWKVQSPIIWILEVFL